MAKPTSLRFYANNPKAPKEVEYFSAPGFFPVRVGNIGEVWIFTRIMQTSRRVPSVTLDYLTNNPVFPILTHISQVFLAWLPRLSNPSMTTGGDGAHDLNGRGREKGPYTYYMTKKSLIP